MDGASVRQTLVLGESLNDLVEAGTTFEYLSSGSVNSGTLLDHHAYRTLFRDNDDGEGSVIAPRHVLRMGVEREEVSFCGIRV